MYLHKGKHRIYAENSGLHEVEIAGLSTGPWHDSELTAFALSGVLMGGCFVRPKAAGATLYLREGE